MKKRLILIFFLLLLLAVGTLVYLGQRHQRTAELYYSGTIEATQANLSFQVSGQVTQVFVDEGQSVEKDQPLAQLDDNESTARLSQAKAELMRTQETLKRIEADRDLYRASLPAEVEQAAASVNQLRAQLKELESGYRTQEIEQARLAVQSARAALDEAARDKARFEALFQQRVIAAKEKDLVDLKHETALREYERTRAGHDLLKEGFRQESIQAARFRLFEGQAVLKRARINLKKIDVAEQEVAAARATVEAARAAAVLAEIQLDHTRLKAPFKGTLTSRNVEPGEVVSPGREVLSLADLSVVELKIFVDEPDIGKVKPGQRVAVKTDTYPQKIYPGRVSFISPEAEFTPKIIQTLKERVKLVYLVKVLMPNPDLELKPGMPADAWLQ